MWLAFPPVDLGWLGWFAPLGWLLLIRRRRLSGWRPYLVLYGIGWIFFGALFYWIMLPHVMAILGWIALTTYLASYLPLFVSVSRVAVHQWKVPLVIVAPIIWTGVEFFRGHLVTGFLMAALGHTQHNWLEIIQCSDLFGAYGVSFLIVFFAAALAMVTSTAIMTSHQWSATALRRSGVLPPDLWSLVAIPLLQFLQQNGYLTLFRSCGGSCGGGSFCLDLIQ